MKHSSMKILAGSMQGLSLPTSAAAPKPGQLAVLGNVLSSRDGNNWIENVRLADPTPLEAYLATKDTRVWLKMTESSPLATIKNHGSYGGEATLYAADGVTAVPVSDRYDPEFGCIKLNGANTIHLPVTASKFADMEYYTIACVHRTADNAVGTSSVYAPTISDVGHWAPNMRINAADWHAEPVISEGGQTGSVPLIANTTYGMIQCRAPGGFYNRYPGDGGYSRVNNVVRADTWGTGGVAKLSGRGIDGFALSMKKGPISVTDNLLRGHLKHFIVLRGQLSEAEALTLYNLLMAA